MFRLFFCFILFGTINAATITDLNNNKNTRAYEYSDITLNGEKLNIYGDYSNLQNNTIIVNNKSQIVISDRGTFKNEGNIKYHTDKHSDISQDDFIHILQPIDRQHVVGSADVIIPVDKLTKSPDTEFTIWGNMTNTGHFSTNSAIFLNGTLTNNSGGIIQLLPKTTEITVNIDNKKSTILVDDQEILKLYRKDDVFGLNGLFYENDNGEYFQISNTIFSFGKEETQIDLYGKPTKKTTAYYDPGSGLFISGKLKCDVNSTIDLAEKNTINVLEGGSIENNGSGITFVINGEINNHGTFNTSKNSDVSITGNGIFNNGKKGIINISGILNSEININNSGIIKLKENSTIGSDDSAVIIGESGSIFDMSESYDLSKHNFLLEPKELSRIIIPKKITKRAECITVDLYNIKEVKKTLIVIIPKECQYINKNYQNLLQAIRDETGIKFINKTVNITVEFEEDQLDKKHISQNETLEIIGSQNGENFEYKNGFKNYGHIILKPGKDKTFVNLRLLKDSINYNSIDITGGTLIVNDKFLNNGHKKVQSGIKHITYKKLGIDECINASDLANSILKWQKDNKKWLEKNAHSFKIIAMNELKDIDTNKTLKNLINIALLKWKADNNITNETIIKEYFTERENGIDIIEYIPTTGKIDIKSTISEKSGLSISSSSAEFENCGNMKFANNTFLYIGENGTLINRSESIIDFTDVRDLESFASNGKCIFEADSICVLPKYIETQTQNFTITLQGTEDSPVRFRVPLDCTYLTKNVRKDMRLETLENNTGIKFDGDRDHVVFVLPQNRIDYLNQHRRTSNIETDSCDQEYYEDCDSETSEC